MKLNANGTEISLITDTKSNEDYISLTDIAKYRNPDDPSGVIANWLRNRNTIEYLGLWEKMNNPNFNPLEFEGFKNDAGLNSFTLSPQKWIVSTNAIGIISRPGRYGGTFAHTDIAFEFASWVSPEFKLYVIKDYQRLKSDEAHRLEIGWDTKRDFASVEQLIVLVNLESMNADLIHQGLSTQDRLKKLRSVAYYQLNSLYNSSAANKLKSTIQNQIKQK